MNRYLSSFIISVLLYTTAIASVLYAVSANSYSDKDVKVQNVQKVNFSIVTPENKPKIEKTKPKTKPKKIQKPKPKPKPIKKELPSIHKPEPIKEKPIEEKKEVEKAEEEQVEQVQKKEVVTNIASKKACDAKSKAKKELFIANLIKQINNNKSYPKPARRRSIEGKVDIEFTVLSDGSVQDINMISGKNIFKKSAIQAINKSFPIDVEESLFDFPKQFKIKIAYVLK